MRGHLQKLDTVEFTRDEYTGSVLAGKIADARVRAVLYSVFYEPTLAPNQVLDLLLFRELHESEPLKLTPFVLHVDSAVHGAAHPFQGQLELLLRRGGPQAFIFSSVPKGISKARAWGKFVEENPEISKKDLLAEASSPNYYPEIVDWANKLDGSNLPVQSYTTTATYQVLFSEFLHEHAALKGLEFLEIAVPQNRSETYQRIKRAAKSDDQKNEMKRLPDFLSNMQYAIGTGAKLIIENELALPSDSQTVTKAPFANVFIDLDGLLDKYPQIEPAIRDANLEKISRALSKSRAEIRAGWDLIKDKKAASKHFANGLKTFLTFMIESEVKESPILNVSPYWEPPNWESPGGKVGVDVSAGFLERVVRKFKFRGLSKFINVK